MNRRRGRTRGWWVGAGVAMALVPTLLACRYNVRDLGFIDVAEEDYALLAVFADAAPDDALLAEQRRLEQACRDSNVHPAVLRRSEGARHPLAAALNRVTLAPLPARVLCSPDDFAVRLDTLLPPPATAAALLNDSPLRRKIARGCARAYGVILLLEGRDPARNAAAREAIQAAVAAIQETMADLPKAITAPPEWVALAAADWPRETVLCWSLGLTPRVTDAPRAAVFYGKARWIGPLMEGAQISRANLVRLFAVIGADCECGMDLSWTRGTALPLRWTDELHALAARSLGFDPASPLVRAEALRIINRYRRGERGPNYAARAEPDTAPPPDRSTPPPSPAHVRGVADAPLRPAVSNVARPPDAAAEPEGSLSLWLLGTAAALGLGLALAAALLLLKQSRRD